MMKFWITTLFICSAMIGWAQQPTTYYLPDLNYDKNIPTPEAFFGHQIGEWHLSHDKLVMYMRELAEVSERVQLTEYARSHEGRPLVYLTISSKKNLERLEEIKAEHLQLCDPAASTKINIEKMPVVVYQGFSIHGNEASGGNAAPLLAYYLAAGKGKEVEKILENAVVLFDPCYNPDGFHRFSSWVNMHKNHTLTADPQDREYHETWPGGRTNHYWFDLNRDWLPLVHPESKGRIQVFHEWKPNVLTDHHEMGRNSTYFFQPGVAERTNPLTPAKNQELTAKIGQYHANALDDLGSFYFSGERFDDFYYGKGSTYPDVNGCVGILFEQASSRGHVQETENGLLSFPFTIRNQVATGLSTLKASVDLRKNLLNYQRSFYESAWEDSKKHSIKAYAFTESKDRGKLDAFIQLLAQHQIEVYQTRQDLTIQNKPAKAADTYLVPTNQLQFRFIRSLFETNTSFQDSLFYDVSTWTLPLAFNISYEALRGNGYSGNLLGQRVNALAPTEDLPDFSTYAYLLEWEDYYSPRALNQILSRQIRSKVATFSFTLDGKTYAPGTIMIPVQHQPLSAEQLYTFVQEVAQSTGVRIRDVDTGLTPQGIDLGSNDFKPVRRPNVLLVVGDGASAYDAGEVWHLLDQRYNMSISMIEGKELIYMNLKRYSAIVFVDGSYDSVISGTAVQKLREWNNNGGTIVGMKRAAKWLNTKGLANLEFKSAPKSTLNKRRPYGKLSNDRGSQVIGGAIFEVEIDPTHPLFFGYDQKRLPVFRRGTLAFKPSRNIYASPAIYTASPLLSGYSSVQNVDLLKNSASIIVSGKGRGKVICLADNPNFRAFWYGTNKIFANALFFGNIISNNAVER